MGEAVITGTVALPLLLAGLGLVVGVYGALIGVGGALLLVPALIFLYPEAEPLALTAVSLSIVLINAAGATAAYIRQKRIDFKSGAWFAAAAIPGVWLGIFTLGHIDREPFMLIFGIAMIIIAGTLIRQPSGSNEHRAGTPGSGRLRAGAGLSLGGGFLSGLLGIGGGIIHVPMMTRVLGFPTHRATATSSYILVFTAAVGVITHLAQGNLSGNWEPVPWLAMGVIAGSQLGAALSRRLKGRTLMAILAVSLMVTGLRLLAG